MERDSRPGGPRFTPEKTKAWTLALYPAAAAVGVAFLLITNRPITTEIIGLFVALITAGGLQVAIKKNGDSYADPDRTSSRDRGVRDTGSKELGKDDWRGTDDSDRWGNRCVSIRGREMGGLPAAIERIRRLRGASGSLPRNVRVQQRPCYSY